MQRATRRARGDEALGVGGAVAALALIAVALFHQHPALAVGEHAAERMVTGGARPPGDVEGAAQQRFIIGAKGSGGHGEGSTSGREGLA